MTKKTKKTKKAAVRAVHKPTEKKAPVITRKPRVVERARPAPRRVSPAPERVTAPKQDQGQSGWTRVLGHWTRDGELAKGHEWYDDGGNEGLKQRPITED